MKKSENIDGIYMVEPFLVGFKGHYYNYVKSLYNIVTQKKIFFKIFIPNNCDTKIKQTIPSEVVFEKLPNDSIFNTKIGRYFTAIWKYNIHMYKGLKNISKNNDLKNKILFFGTIQHVHVFALIFWLMFTSKSKLPSKIVLTLRLSIYRYDINRWSLISIWYVIGLNLLSLFKKKYNIKLITDSDGLVKEFSKITNFHIDLLPIPHTVENIKVEKFVDERLDNRIIFTSIGEARVNKGFKLICNAIEKLSHQDIFNNVIFKLHCYHKINDYEVAGLLKNLKEKNFPNVELIQNNLNEEEYYKLLINSDVILIPYNFGIYAANTSGIFTESLSFSKVVIVTKGTWASNNLTYGSGIEIKDQDFNELADAIKRITINIEEYKKEANIKSFEWNKYHNPDNFYKMLIGL